MGATDFGTVGRGATPKEAFAEARARALHEHGHGGYTGTIAEKTSFRLITVLPHENPMKIVQIVMDDEDHWIQDKWGPAGAIKLREGEWYFFGIASE